jgi:Phosphate-selective porin O and P
MNFKLLIITTVVLIHTSVISGQDYRGEEGKRVVAASEFWLGNLPQDSSADAEAYQYSRSVAKTPRLTSNDFWNQESKLPAESADNTDEKKKEAASKSDEKKADEKKDDKKKDEKKKKEWYEKISLRGYVQFRYNYPTFTQAGSAARQHAGDGSVSSRQEFFIRRARLIFFGDIGEHLYLYVQPDLASTPNASVDQIQFAQIRDCYADVYMDKGKVHRLRVGQSKIPYGWENLQSSQNRLSLDRNDAFNSAARNERDTGVFYYWTPKWAQDFFKDVNDQGLKGSGNYGIFGLGAYNGQGGSLREQNDSLHLISRLTIPFCTMWDNRWEVGMQGYSGDYVVLGERISPLGVGAAAVPLGTRDTGGAQGHLDQRVGWSVIRYPQPFGLQAEYTIGKTPQLNAAQTEIEMGSLHGGYWMAYYRYKSPCHGEFWPFVRYQYYRGGYRSAANSPFSEIDEWNFGTEWQIQKEFELVTEYVITDRTNLQASSSGESYRQYQGHLLRFQFQWNF